MSKPFPSSFPLSDRVQRIAPSLTLAITAKANELKRRGVKVIAFAAGEPDFPTPEPVCEEAIAALRRGKTKYTPEDGIVELKDAIISRFAEELGITYSHDEVAVTVGGKQAIYNLLMAAVNPGDGVLILSPYWVSYPEMVRLCDGEPQIVPTDFSQGFRLNLEALEKAVTPRTRGIILNSPSNPTGHVLDRSELEGILSFVTKHGLWVISDEIYNRLTYGGVKGLSLLNLAPELKERVAVVNGVSKTFSMTGWRIGYMAGPRTWIRAAAKVQGQSTSNPTSIAQYAALRALTLDYQVVEAMRQKFEERRNLMCASLRDVPGLHFAQPEGAFYLFPCVSERIAARKLRDDVELAERLLTDVQVAVVPGSGFGAPGYIRLSYATSEEEIMEGCQRIARWFSQES